MSVLYHNKLYQIITNSKIYFSELKNSTNPDFTFADLICELEFSGWIRYGTENIRTMGDEVIICNIKNAVKTGLVEQNKECDLGEYN